MNNELLRQRIKCLVEKRVPAKNVKATCGVAFGLGFLLSLLLDVFVH